MEKGEVGMKWFQKQRICYISLVKRFDTREEGEGEGAFVNYSVTL